MVTSLTWGAYFEYYNITISLSCHEQVCLSGLRFERYFSHHQARWWEKYLSKRSPLKHTCSWHDKLIVLWILNRQAKKKDLYVYRILSFKIFNIYDSEVTWKFQKHPKMTKTYTWYKSIWAFMFLCWYRKKKSFSKPDKKLANTNFKRSISKMLIFRQCSQCS